MFQSPDCRPVPAARWTGGAVNTGAGVNAMARRTLPASAENQLEAFLPDLLNATVSLYYGTFTFIQSGFKLRHTSVILLFAVHIVTAVG
jgi:hypothetical protein